MFSCSVILSSGTQGMIKETKIISLYLPGVRLCWDSVRDAKLMLRKLVLLVNIHIDELPNKLAEPQLSLHELGTTSVIPKTDVQNNHLSHIQCILRHTESGED